MTYASTLFDDIARGISATAPTADDEVLIELHSALKQQVFSHLYLCHSDRSDRNLPSHAEGERLPQAA